MIYREYIESEEWEEKSERCKRLANYKCEICGGEKRITSHHYNYEKLGREDPEDLFCLCGGCHFIYHLKVKRLPLDFLNREERLKILKENIPKRMSLEEKAERKKERSAEKKAKRSESKPDFSFLDID